MIRMSRILCPVDFSDFSRHALDHAVTLARQYGARLSVLYVHRLATPALAVGPVVLPETFMPAMLTENERTQILQRLAHLAPGDETTSVDTLLAENPSVADAIVNAAEELDADLVVLGTHGRSGFRRLVLGSVAEKVLRMAPRPVMIVPPGVGGAVPQTVESVRHVLCPVDFSSSSSRALEYAASFAAQASGVLTVLHVVQLLPEIAEIPPPDFAGYHRLMLDNAERRMADTVTPAVRAACQLEELIVTGTPYREILRVAAERQADLTVMGVQGRGAADLAFFGSTTQHVVRQATCPVLTLRASQ